MGILKKKAKQKPAKKSSAKTQLNNVRQNKSKSTKNCSKKKPTVEARDEFRTHKKNGHPSYIYAKVNGKYKYIGITHSKITNGVKNIELEQNPNPNDKEKAYARTMAKKDKVKKFKAKPLAGWKMSERDKKKIKPITK